MGALTHVALFTWKVATTDQDVQALCDGLATLPGLIPEIKRYQFGPDAALTEGNADFAVVAEFADVDGYRAYASNPDHLDVIARLVKPIVAQRTAVQLQA